MAAFLPQMEPVITTADADAVDRYMRSGGWLTEFRETRAFEQAIRDFTGAAHCTIAPSGTMALFLALKGLGVGTGDEVIVPDLTMAASATAVVLAGATPVFADIERQSLCLDLDAARSSFTARTKAVMIVALNGRSPVGLTAYIEDCRARGIKVIEDAAQALGSFHAGRHLGTIGDCGCLSFSSQKIVTTGQGGAILTRDEQLYERMALLRDFGRREGGNDHYLTVGWNLKFTDLQAVVGVSQFARLPGIVERKRAMMARYREGLRDVCGVEMPPTDLDEVTPWFIDILVERDRRDALMDFLRQQGIGSRPFYPALHATPAFAAPTACPIASDVSARGLWLPSSLRITDDDIDRTCDAIAAFMSRGLS
jgi:perosamine synthetase